MICEICGRDATDKVQDIREGQPDRADDGSLYRHWDRDGAPHHYCSAHHRAPRELSLDDQAEAASKG